MVPHDTDALIQVLDAMNAKLSNEERNKVIAAARRFVNRLETPWEKLRAICLEYPATESCLKVCWDLDLWNKWKSKNEGKALNAKELAKLSGCEKLLLSRFLRHLVTANLLEEKEPDVYEQTPFTLSLTQIHYSSWIHYLYFMSIPTYAAIPDFVKERGYKHADILSSTDGVFQKAYKCKGTSLFEWYGQNPDYATSFNHAMTGYGAERTSWLEIYPSEKLLEGNSDDKDPVLVDVGGSIGHDVVKFIAAHPQAAPRVVLQDLPKVIEQAIVDKSTGVQVQGYDFFTPEPVHGARAYFMHSVLHDWPDDKAREILNNLRPAFKKGYSVLLLNENIVPSYVKTASPQITSFDITMMAVVGAMERTDVMWRSLLESAGFKVKKIWTSAAAVESIIEAELA